jgi:hypothetical protein
VLGFVMRKKKARNNIRRILHKCFSVETYLGYFSGSREREVAEPKDAAFVLRLTSRRERLEGTVG